MLEIAARPIGGLCSKVLRFTRRGDGAGATLEEVLLRHAVGEDVLDYTREPGAAGVMMIPIPRRGILKKVRGVESAKAVAGVEEIRITAKTHQLLEPLPEAASYLGFIFARGADAPSVVGALTQSHARLRFEIATPIAVRVR